MRYQVTIGGRTRDVDVRPDRSGGWWVSVDGGPEEHVSGGPVGTAEWRVERDGVTRVVGLSNSGADVHLQVAGHPVRARVSDPRKDALSLGAADHAGDVVTEMPGAIVRVLVTEGDTVEQGQPVLVIEAMKMENELKAPAAGTVAGVHVVAGDRVESGALLLTVAAGDGA